MLAFFTSLLAIFGFAFAFKYLKVVPATKEAIAKAHGGVTAILDSRLSDDEKEAAVQTAGLALLKFSVGILWRLAACLLAAAVPIYLFSWAGWVSADVVFRLMLRWEYILGTTVVLGGLVWWYKRSRNDETPVSAYSGSDQLTHKLAFSGPGIQFTACDIEDRFFARKLKGITDQPPVFITSLPRAGTTVLLNALNELPEVATHLYRDMPFVMAPMLWSRISGMFTKPSEMKERAHGDGIQVGYDSPEAFEEVIWQAFWPEKYSADTIPLWRMEDALPEATSFFVRHFRKIVLLRTNGQGRYVSKNNANIARLDLIQGMFPDAQIIVPIREPAEHAASLLRQHQNFLQLHARDPFVARYMRDVGHWEFGALHKPFAFPGFDKSLGSPQDPDYWLAYWIAAYRFVLARADRLNFVTQKKLGEQPDVVMNALCGRLGLSLSGANPARHFRPVSSDANVGMFDRAKLTEAQELYLALSEREI